MTHYLRKRPKSRKRCLSVKQRMKSLTNLKVSHAVDVYMHFNSFTAASTPKALLATYRVELVKSFIQKFIIDKKDFDGTFKSNHCHHLFVSSAHMYELMSKKITLKRLHEYHFTRLNRQKGREAEEWAFKHYSNVLKRLAVRDSSLPFVIVSSDGFIGLISS